MPRRCLKPICAGIRIQNILTPDSFYVNLKGLEQWALHEQNPVSRAVLNSLVASIYANYADNNRWELRNRTSLNLGGRLYRRISANGVPICL
ncbi:MAG: hypothetical protein ACLVL2_30510 [Bacteroides cellulosilyticus]